VANKDATDLVLVGTLTSTARTDSSSLIVGFAARAEIDASEVDNPRLKL
jgi:hypothetical protein